MSLQTYHKKRNFKVTAEPYGRKKSGAKSLYIIQKHAASHLHYDFRLELNGTLKSWAVPRGPSLDPSVKRLAVHVEDHPIEYGSFEGVIPAGQYGGGTVMLWDNGTWECKDENPYAAYKSGKLTFTLKGKKLKGTWKLIQIKNDPKNWLLMKVDDAQAKSEDEVSIIEKKPNSVVSRLTLEGITKRFKGKLPASAKNNGLSSSDKKAIVSKKSPIKKNGATLKRVTPNTIKNKGNKKNIPDEIYPELAFLVDKPPVGSNWLHEIKLDGYRLLCFIKGSDVKIITRNQNDWTNKFPELVSKLKKLKLRSAIIDGELIALGQDQHADFQLLQNSIHDKNTAALVYYAFDLLYLKGNDLTQLPLIERKELLHSIIGGQVGMLRYSEHVVNGGNEILKHACKLGLEGIVSKKIDSPYHEGRSHHWVKVKCVKRQEFVIIGFTDPAGQRGYFGALLLGVYDNNKQLIYSGKVGTGFTHSSLETLGTKLLKYKTSKSPISTVPKGLGRVTWIKPVLLAEIEFSQWTRDGVLRHSSFKGLREDKKPASIIREIPEKQTAKKELDMEKKSMSSEIDFEFSHPEKILYPTVNISKLDLAEYYQKVATFMLPHIIKRPLTIVRCPQGQQAKCFYQKHTNEINIKGLFSVEIKEKSGKEPYLYIKSADGLMALVQLGVLEMHTWGCHIDKVEKPDMIVFDLDPAPDVAWKKVIEGAFFIKEKLDELSLTSFVKTTGGKGLHIVVPIVPQHEWDKIEIFTHTFADYIVSLKPELFLANMSKVKRVGKIFLDYLRNNRGSTAIAPYSTRAKDNASVSVPLNWDELTVKISSDYYTVKNIDKRLKNLKADPWQDFFHLKQKLKLPGKR